MSAITNTFFKHEIILQHDVEIYGFYIYHTHRHLLMIHLNQPQEKTEKNDMQHENWSKCKCNRHKWIKHGWEWTYRYEKWCQYFLYSSGITPWCLYLIFNGYIHETTGWKRPHLAYKKLINLLVTDRWRSWAIRNGPLQHTERSHTSL